MRKLDKQIEIPNSSKFMNHAAFSVGKYYAVAVAAFIILLFGVHTSIYKPDVVQLIQSVNAPFVVPMAETKWLYWILHAMILLPIIALSFDRRVAYYKKWKFLVPAILSIGLLFILWDFIYTAVGVWGFSHDYTLETRVLKLPIEEWMFFVSAPFACVFIYECLRYYFPEDSFAKLDKPISLGLASIFTLIGLLTWGRLYTSFTCLASGVLILSHFYAFANTYRTFFYKALLVSYLPFILVNGVLTGSITKTPIVQYNPLEMLDIRFVTIPVEDFVYCFMMLFLVIIVYEKLQAKQYYK